MQKRPTSETGAFNPRLFLAFTLCCFGGLLALVSFAATPPSGTLTDTSGPLTYSAGPFTTANPSPVIQVDDGPRCNGQFNCDSYTLTVNVPPAYMSANPGASVKVTMSWTDTGTGNSDYDLYVFKGAVGNTNGSVAADFQSASGANPEIAAISPLVAGPQTFTIKIVPYTPTRETVNVKIELQAGSGGGGGGGGGGGPFGGRDTTAPGKPRYQNFFAPTGSSAEASSGEFNIGFNPKTGRIMAMNAGPIWRITPPELVTPALPECCEGFWQDRSSTVTDTGLDPILFTDAKTGRTFASNATAGANILYAYSDSDGEPSATQPTGWTPIGAAPANGGADHQTIGSGPFPASLSALTTLVNQGQYVLYCSQDLVGAFCQASYDLGMSYGPGVSATGNGIGSQGCGGLHGHVRIAPDGTAYLPDDSCSGKQGGSFSLDANTSPWTEFVVQKLVGDADGPAFTANSQSNGADPSIGIDKANTLYYCYVNNQAGGTEGHAHVAVGKRTGSTITWIRDVDIGAAQGVVNATHTEAIAGDAGRAACGFYGTNVAGNYQSGTFPGVWYPFIATTYDEGRTWVTVNASPNDPIQNMTGIWQQGGSGQNGNRNLLDFNEITMDNQGRVLYGYSDGCHTQACIDGTPGDRGAFMRVARQSGGRTLLAAYDGMTDTTVALAPKAPCLSGTRTAAASLLTWKAPDNRGADIVNYQIFRSNSAGNEVYLGQTGNDSTTYRDLNPPNDPTLYYRVVAINSVGSGPMSNEIALTIATLPPVESVCLVPGLTILSDKAADTSAALGLVSTPAPAGSDLLSFRLSQPYQADGIPRLVFVINTDPNPSGTQSPGWAAYVAMKIVKPDNSTVYKGVHLTYSPTMKFEVYTPSPNSGGTVDGRFVAASPAPTPAEASSNYDGPNGKITIVVKASDLGLALGDTIGGFVSGVSQTTDPTGAAPASATALYDQMPDSLTFASSYTLPKFGTCSAPGFVSRQAHGSVGEFDIALGAGSPVEPRTGSPAGTYTFVYATDSVLTGAGVATLTGATAAGPAVIGPNSNQVSIPLTGVPDTRHVSVTLNGVVKDGGSTLNGLTGQMDVLVGDANGDRVVNSGDSIVVRNASGQLVTSANFTSDVNNDGALNTGDSIVTRNASGHTVLGASGPAKGDTATRATGR